MLKHVCSSVAALALCCAWSQPAFADRDDPEIHYGDSATVGGAKVRTYVVLIKDKAAIGNHKVPVELGIEIPESALRNLPSQERMWVLYFPNQAWNMRLQYMMLDWNPSGHPPEMYQLPHFDFHFYMQDLAEVMRIGPNDFERGVTDVPAQFVPRDYVNVGAFEPQMGNHLIDFTSPEFAPGGLFTRTFIYGSFDGKVTFYEPMITLDSLARTPNACLPIKQPQAWAESGYYPTRYCTSFDPRTRTYRVSISDFVYRTGTSGSAR
ncbi:hypothetical protein [Vulgatibacter incomptus]|uniref:DUF5602 domain-containing protein n=1 Tax=Vulgatibacter incomptus TaxID=1391653 RepID=A0A0K1P8V2_9BACT|nr:hypothetical protein [Vulgatibacter incomptus]AKU89950.1 hypothetical protein AKJ08_0337 [Vulgatibacter incomptus]